MKQSPLQRKTPLKASKGLTRSVLVRRSPLRAGLTVRKPARRTGPSRSVVELVFDRDGGRCVRCGRFVRFEMRGVDWSCQHRDARGMGGTRRPEANAPSNLIVLCGSATTGCHFWAESNRSAAYAGGWLLHDNQVPSAVPVESWWGWVYLDDAGRWTEVPS